MPNGDVIRMQLYLLQLTDDLRRCLTNSTFIGIILQEFVVFETPQAFVMVTRETSDGYERIGHLIIGSAAELEVGDGLLSWRDETLYQVRKRQELEFSI